MNRRRFCKIGAFALGALGVGSLEGLASERGSAVEGIDGVLSRACRVTVMRRECYDDIQAMYLDDPETGPCSKFATGEHWDLGKGESCPAGFCRRAWHSIVETVNSKRSCADMMRDISVVACPDGTRPVIFRIEMF